MPDPVPLDDDSPIEHITESSVQRVDQHALGLGEELAERAARVKRHIAEGRVQEAYDALQEVLETSAELMKGFQFMGDIEPRPIQRWESAGERLSDETDEPPWHSLTDNPFKPVVYSRHARDRMSDPERGPVTEDEVEFVLENPSVSYVGDDGKPNVLGEVNGKRIRVCYVEEESRRLIITVINRGSSK